MSARDDAKQVQWLQPSLTPHPGMGRTQVEVLYGFEAPILYVQYTVLHFDFVYWMGPHRI